MLVLKTLLNVGMEKVVPTKQSRRHSTGNLAFEYTDISSRYLKDPIPSCHDNCKPLDNTTTERSNKIPSTFKKLFTLIPKPTKDAKITNTSLIKNQIKPLPNEPIKRNILKSKPKNDPFYIPPSTTHRRRYSEIILPIGGLEDVLDPDPPPVPGFTRSSKKIDSKIELRKDPVKNANIHKKIPTLKTHSSLPNIGVDHGSRKSKPTKPIEETVKEKIDKIRSPTSNERVIENGSNEASTSNKEETLNTHDESPISSTSKKNETLKSHDQINGVGNKKPETSRRVGKLHGDNLPQKMKFKQGKVVDAVSSGSSSSKRLNFQRQESIKSDEKRQNGGVSLRRSCSESDGVLQREESIKSMNVVLNKTQEPEKKHRRHSSNNLIEETASKLIQARKSRVQALVGAFEIVSEAKL